MGPSPPAPAVRGIDYTQRRPTATLVQLFADPASGEGGSMTRSTRLGYSQGNTCGFDKRRPRAHARAPAPRSDNGYNPSTPPNSPEPASRSRNGRDRRRMDRRGIMTRAAGCGAVLIGRNDIVYVDARVWCGQRAVGRTADYQHAGRRPVRADAGGGARPRSGARVDPSFRAGGLLVPESPRLRHRRHGPSATRAHASMAPAHSKIVS